MAHCQRQAQTQHCVRTRCSIGSHVPVRGIEGCTGSRSKTRGSTAPALGPAASGRSSQAAGSPAGPWPKKSHIQTSWPELGGQVSHWRRPRGARESFLVKNPGPLAFAGKVHLKLSSVGCARGRSCRLRRERALERAAAGAAEALATSAFSALRRWAKKSTWPAPVPLAPCLAERELVSLSCSSASRSC